MCGITFFKLSLPRRIINPKSNHFPHLPSEWRGIKALWQHNVTFLTVLPASSSQESEGEGGVENDSGIKPVTPSLMKTDYRRGVTVATGEQFWKACDQRGVCLIRKSALGWLTLCLYSLQGGSEIQTEVKADTKAPISSFFHDAASGVQRAASFCCVCSLTRDESFVTLWTLQCGQLSASLTIQHFGGTSLPLPLCHLHGGAWLTQVLVRSGGGSAQFLLHTGKILQINLKTHLHWIVPAKC